MSRMPIDDLEHKLFDERPRPTPGFRSEVRTRLLTRVGSRPPQIRALIFSYAAGGILLLAIALLGVSGAGPLAGG
jgi:hypothetical protein